MLGFGRPTVPSHKFISKIKLERLLEIFFPGYLSKYSNGYSGT